MPIICPPKLTYCETLTMAMKEDTLGKCESVREAIKNGETESAALKKFRVSSSSYYEFKREGAKKNKQSNTREIPPNKPSKEDQLREELEEYKELAAKLMSMLTKKKKDST